MASGTSLSGLPSPLASRKSAIEAKLYDWLRSVTVMVKLSAATPVLVRTWGRYTTLPGVVCTKLLGVSVALVGGTTTGALTVSETMFDVPDTASAPTMPEAPAWFWMIVPGAGAAWTTQATSASTQAARRAMRPAILPLPMSPVVFTMPFRFPFLSSLAPRCEGPGKRGGALEDASENHPGAVRDARPPGRSDTVVTG